MLLEWLIVVFAEAHNPSEQVPRVRVGVFSRTTLFLERFWREFGISFYFSARVNKTYRPNSPNSTF